MKDSVAFLVFCVKFVVTELVVSITEFQVATVVEDSSKEAFAGKEFKEGNADH